ncbi:MAG TPA: DNA-processing protein DprA, partial [Actinomycetota bacterium]|nr:DNA-processing protein DprA [Actinomycetota bacterium]
MPPGFPDGYASGDGAREALLVLSALRGIKPYQLHELAWSEGTAQASLAAIRMGAAASEADRAWARELDPASVEREAAALGVRFVTPADDEYLPVFLELLHDPPVALYVSGTRLTELPERVSVVGARNCSPTGNEVAMSIGAGLGGVGVCVVSGAARGIDAASHRGALTSGGTSIAVLGSGHDLPYPKASSELVSRVAAAGAAVSEYAPGVPAEPFRFPARNRLVAALGRALVVVEGAHGSGSMISVDHALDLGREVFAVPGPVTSPLAEIPLALIREGATMIRGADDLLDDLGYTARLRLEPPPNLEGDELRVYEALGASGLP